MNELVKAKRPKTGLNRSEMLSESNSCNAMIQNGILLTMIWQEASQSNIYVIIEELNKRNVSI